ncbi:hypothetical protein BDK51DRAFT_14694, partial [Blyttiomyces helicus]
MATVIRQLWGPNPSFLRAPRKWSLFELVAHRPGRGVGLKVVPKDWDRYNDHDSYYIVSKVEFDFVS